MGMQEKYDTAFLGIIQNEGNIDGFLDSVFSFLYRRTDFYQHINEEKTRGFPPGVASKIVYKNFKKYNDKADELREKARERALRMEERMRQAQQTPPVAQEVEIDEEPQKQEEAEKPQAQAEAPTAPTVNGKAESEAEKPKEDEPKEVKKEEPEAKKQDEDTKKEEKKEEKKDEEEDPDDDPELTKMQRIYQANPDSYNGAIRDKYSWGQEITEVDARIKIPQHITSAKQCRVTISKKHLKVCVAPPSGSGEWETILDDDLSWEVKVDESMWTLVNDVPRPGQDRQRNIHINLEKVQERWWDALVAGEPKISVRKIDPSRPMTDLDDEAQAKLEEMMWNERQKALGLPQSGQLKMQNMLKTAWDAEGSPFKGQPFDLTKVNISGDGSSMNFNPPPSSS